MFVSDRERFFWYGPAMPRFFLNLDQCGLRSLDHEGFQADHLDAARTAGIQAARDIMADEVRAGRLCLDCRVEVTDADGVVVLVVPFKEAIEVKGLD